MTDGTRAVILLDLSDPGEFGRLSIALEREGIVSKGPSTSAASYPDGLIPEFWLDEEVRLAEANFVLVDIELFFALGMDTRRTLRSYVVVVLVDPGDSERAAACMKAGAFDAITRGGEAWEESAATYLRVVAGMWKRFSGAFGHLERRYENLVHALPDIVYELDEAGRFTFLNNSVRLLGYEPSELSGKHFSVLLQEEDALLVDREAILPEFLGSRTGPALSPKLFNERRSIDRRTENLELVLKRKASTGGGELYATIIAYGEVTAAGEYLGAGGFIGTVGVIRDITMRRKSEDMLRKLYQAVDQLAAGILIVDMDFSIEYANPTFLRMTEREPTEVIGQSILSFFEIEAKRAAEVMVLVREGFDVRDELPLRRASGELLWTAGHASPVREPSGVITHAIIVCEDISQTRAMADLLRAAKDEAERADRAKSDFLASMGHELKGPLASVLAAARLIEMGGAEPEKRAASIIASAQGLLELLGDILDFVRFETGSATLRRLSFPLATFVKKICEPWQLRARAKGLEFEIGSLEEAVVNSDPDRLGRAFAALLMNAVDFTLRGKVRVEASVQKRRGNVPYLVIAVSDTGLGIPVGDQGRIFAPFVQLGSPYTKTAGGAGIGLSLARNIVRALGGEIRLESEQGKGSLFTILVPVGQPESAEVLPVFASGHRAWRLLVVDDNEINLDFMAALLGGTGHLIERAESALEALNLLEERLVDAAILDIQMPGMSGIELGRKIRGYQGERYDRSMSLVALTAFGPEEVTRSSVDFDQVLTKPADIPALIAALDQSIVAREVESEGFFSRRWAGRPTAGAASLARLELEMPGLCATLIRQAEAGEREAMRDMAQSMARRVAQLGASAMQATLQRLSLVAPSEDLEVLATRAERLARRWERLLAQARAELRSLEGA